MNPTYTPGARVTWQGHPGTVTHTRIERGGSIPDYQRITVEFDPNPEHVIRAEGASRHFRLVEE